MRGRGVAAGRRLGLLAVGAALIAPSVALAQDGATLTLVAYSTPREAYEEIIPLFQETEAGAEVEFEQSYGGSGDQSRAVEGGLAADIVALSLAPDVDRLVEPGVVPEDWAENEYDGFVTRSVVVFAVRPGNPKNIQTWDDLVRDDVAVVTPNPLTSGGAKWNIMAAWGAQTTEPAAGASPEAATDEATEEAATEYLRELFANVAVQDKSARESLTTFLGGQGDVLLAYENEVITAQQAGEEIEYVLPDETILIENPIAVTSESDNAEQAQAFVDFARSPEGQRIFAEKGYRSVLDEVPADFPEFEDPAGLFTIEAFGGWSDVNEKFFSEDGIVASVQDQ
ncbi:MAG: Sulfate and thiosulfate binding protein CysP [uncultured Thermomicrobiales bacterium]|uniref:Sulfate and thiosulfate binding protein CysP n=1 Tax=uncultured Thermomicrobiales bacterium TaxID=1645740 RepID=A0A6J4UKK4_9BACT|nr:MAG: Sulfate and thiosulfate binding protein CysP [uncultured Thermomicrobiales bacterium]